MDKDPRNERNVRRKSSQSCGDGASASDDCSQMDDIIGSFGKYQFMIFMFKILIGATSAFNNLGVTFFAPTDFVSYRCADADLRATSINPLTQTTPSPLNSTYTLGSNSTFDFTQERQSSYLDSSSLHRYANNHTNHTLFNREHRGIQDGFLQLFGDFISNNERAYKHSLKLNSDTPKNIRKECDYLSPVDNKRHQCTSYQYDTGIWISTIIDEWDLVCNRAWFISVTQSLYMAGFIVSYLMFGYISDRFGRWNSLMLGAFIEISSGFGCAFASSITQFMIFRFLLGLGNAGRSSSSYLIMIEWTGVRWRMHISTLGTLGWILGYCTMPWLGLFFLHFRHMQLFVCFYETVFLIWLLGLPESPRWLLTHRRFREARDVLFMAAKFNGLILKKIDQNIKPRDILTTSPSSGYLIQEECSLSSSQSSDSSQCITATNDSAICHETKANGDLTRNLQVIMATEAVDAERMDVKSCEIKQRRNSLAHASVDDVPPDMVPGKRSAYGFLMALCGPCTSWFCGEGQAKEIKPYTVEEFESRFKRLITITEAKEFTKNEDRLSILDLFKWRNLRKYTFILAAAWAINSFIYYGIALRVGDFGSKNLFVAFTFAGATELPSIAFSMVAMKLLPRRTTNVVMFSTILLLCALQVPLRYYDCQWLQVVTMMLAKLFNSCSFTCILYQTMELFPTSIRQTAYSSCSLAGRIGSILAPFIKELSQLTNNLVPPIIYAFLSILEIISIRYLPETQGADLPDTLLEAEKFKGTDKVRRENSIEIAERGEMDKSK